MGIHNHYEGFEEEEKFHMVLGIASRDCPVIMARSVKNIIAHYQPELVERLFEIKKCERRLRYIGCGCEEKECPHGPGLFEHGKIYESIDFNGATYSIKNYEAGEKRIGFVYFEWVEDNDK